jgi:segregation and condensation protein B
MADKKGKSAAKQQAAGESAEREELEDLIEDAVGGGSWPVRKLKPVLEAVLFAAGDPLTLKRMSEVITGATRVEFNAALKELQSDYESRGIGLIQVAGGWQLRTAPEHQSVVKKLFKERPFRLTRAGVETLAIVAYRQPATRAEIEAVRGVDCSGVLEGLVERKVVKIAGRRDVPGRPLVYMTTTTFLEMFGLNDLKSMPTLAELGDEFTNLAEQTGFSESEERYAPVLPFEGDDGEGQEQTAGAQDDEAVEQQDVEQEGTKQKVVDNAGERQAVAQTNDDHELKADDKQQDQVPKIHFRKRGQADQGSREAREQSDEDDADEDDSLKPAT